MFWPPTKKTQTKQTNYQQNIGRKIWLMSVQRHRKCPAEQNTKSAVATTNKYVYEARTHVSCAEAEKPRTTYVWLSKDHPPCPRCWALLCCSDMPNHACEDFVFPPADLPPLFHLNPFGPFAVSLNPWPRLPKSAFELLAPDAIRRFGCSSHCSPSALFVLRSRSFVGAEWQETRCDAKQRAYTFRQHKSQSTMFVFFIVFFLLVYSRSSGPGAHNKTIVQSVRMIYDGDCIQATGVEALFCLCPSPFSLRMSVIRKHPTVLATWGSETTVINIHKNWIRISWQFYESCRYV